MFWRSLTLPITKSSCVYNRSHSSGRKQTSYRPTSIWKSRNLAVREFQEGTVRETIEDFEGRIFLARSEFERAERPAELVAPDAPEGVRSGCHGHIGPCSGKTRWHSPSATRVRLYAVQEIHGSQDRARTRRRCAGGQGDSLNIKSFAFSAISTVWRRSRSRLDNCTIRAPHDGFVIYANNPDRQLFIEPGLPVRERQQLFYLPDLNDMEVVAMLHESIVNQVDPACGPRFRLKD